jgi:anti-anti-sigma factor
MGHDASDEKLDHALYADELLRAGAVVTAIGEVDMVTAHHLAAVVQAALDTRPGMLVIDLSEVTFLGCSGLAALAAARHTAGETDQSLRVVVGDRHPVIRPLTATGLADHLDLLREHEVPVGEVPVRETAARGAARAAAGSPSARTGRPMLSNTS